MKSLVLFVLAMTAGSFAQVPIPAGTILPVQLNSSLRSNKARPGETISARIMQDVPLTAHSSIHAGAKVIGHVVAVTAPTETTKAELSFTFDTVVDGKRRLPVSTNLRALASMMDVAEAQTPETGPDRGTSSDSWTTDLIGGEADYRGAVVAQGLNVVGRSLLGDRVLARVSAPPGAKCGGAVEGNDQPQALWVFSSDACGIYDYPNVVLAHAGRTDPVGRIMLQWAPGDLNIRAGSGLLLRVN